MAVLIPHFDLPFRFYGNSTAVVEQDSNEDIANCVEAILRTPSGTRDDVEQFGTDDLTFSNRPVNIDLLTSQILSQEPRAEILMREESEIFGDLVAIVIAEIGKA